MSIFHGNEFQRGIQFYESGLRALNPDGERKPLKFVIAKGKAILYKIMGESNKVLKIVEDIWDGIDRSESINNETLYDLYEINAELYLKCGLIQEAKNILLEGLHKAQDKMDFEFMGNLWHSLGVVHTKLGGWDVGEECLQYAIDQKQGFITRTYTWLGVLYMEKGDLEKSEKALKEAIDEGKKENKSFRMVSAYIAMGDLKMKMVNPKESLLFYEKAKKIAEKQKNLEGKEIVCLSRIAEVIKGVDNEQFQECILRIHYLQKNTQKGGVFYNEID